MAQEFVPSVLKPLLIHQVFHNGQVELPAGARSRSPLRVFPKEIPVWEIRGVNRSKWLLHGEYRSDDSAGPASDRPVTLARGKFSAAAASCVMRWCFSQHLGRTCTQYGKVSSWNLCAITSGLPSHSCWTVLMSSRCKSQCTRRQVLTLLLTFLPRLHCWG